MPCLCPRSTPGLPMVDHLTRRCWKCWQFLARPSGLSKQRKVGNLHAKRLSVVAILHMICTSDGSKTTGHQLNMNE
eukprot:scaffold46553_cov18-Tisochrysis_lutea.AAC.1